MDAQSFASTVSESNFVPINKRASTKTFVLLSKAVEDIIYLREQEPLVTTSNRDYIAELASEIPDHLLSHDWYKEGLVSPAFVATVKKLLPTLILGIEHLLKEVEKRGLMLTETVCPNFNPLNYLAHFLCVNHPGRLTASDKSGYIILLQKVTRKIHQQFDSISKKPYVLQIKEKVKKTRFFREREKLKKIEELKQFKIHMHSHFLLFTSKDHPKVNVSVLVKVLDSLEETIREVLDEPMEGRDFDPKIREQKLTEINFAEFLIDYIDQSKIVTTDILLEYLNKTALMKSSLKIELERRYILNGLFAILDEISIGKINRHKIIKMIKTYYETCPDFMKEELNDPSTWPVLEPEETSLFKRHVLTESSDLFSSEEKNVESSTWSGEGDHTGSGTHSTTGSTDFTTSGGATSYENTGGGEETGLSSSKKFSQVTGSMATSEREYRSRQTKSQSVIKKYSQITMSSKSSSLTDIESPDSVMSAEFGQEDIVKWLTYRFNDIDNWTENFWLNKMKKNIDRINKFTRTEENQIVFAMSRSPSWQESVSSEDENSAFKTKAKETRLSAFSTETLTASQFIQIMLTFTSKNTSKITYDFLFGFLHENFINNKMERLNLTNKIKQEQDAKICETLTDTLFNLWDIDKCRYLSTKFLEKMVDRYQNQADPDICDILDMEMEAFKDTDKIYKPEFYEFVCHTREELEEDAAEFFEFISKINMTQEDLFRSSARQTWYNQCKQVSKVCGFKMDLVYNTVFDVISDDALAFGGGKHVSSYIALLTCDKTTELSHLKYVAATVDHYELLQDKILKRNMPCLSFLCIDRGVPVHVPKVSCHGRVHFWRKDVNGKGSLLLIPLKNKADKVFGLLAVDTLINNNSNCVFIGHEMKFYQGIAKAFSISYHRVEVRRKFMCLAENALWWVHKLCSKVTDICLFYVLPDEDRLQPSMRKVMLMLSSGEIKHIKKSRNFHETSLFKDHLFNCLFTSQTVQCSGYGDYRLAYPIRCPAGYTRFIVEFLMKDEHKNLPFYDQYILHETVKHMQTGYTYFWEELQEGEEYPKVIAAEQQKVSDALKVSVLFERLMLDSVREKLVYMKDPVLNAMVSDGSDPPNEVCYNIIFAVVYILYPDSDFQKLSNDWNSLRELISPELYIRLFDFDPTSNSKVDSPVIQTNLRNISPGDAAALGSWILENMYLWLLLCLALSEKKPTLDRDECCNEDNICGFHYKDKWMKDKEDKGELEEIKEEGEGEVEGEGEGEREREGEKEEEAEEEVGEEVEKEEEEEAEEVREEIVKEEEEKEEEEAEEVREEVVKEEEDEAEVREEVVKEEEATEEVVEEVVVEEEEENKAT